MGKGKWEKNAVVTTKTKYFALRKFFTLLKGIEKQTFFGAVCTRVAGVGFLLGGSVAVTLNIECCS